jgi:hypothetical protein
MGESCQDSCWAQVDSSGASTPTLSIFVADGAGSAIRGGIGSDLAIEAAVDFVAGHLKRPELTLSDELAVQCIIAVRDRIYAHAELKGLKARDYACTFLGVLSSLQTTLVMQIGDGAIVLDVGDGLEVPFEPMSGEYANMTRFVTDEDAVNILLCKAFPRRASKVAAFSDGIQRLALDMATNTPHEPFFAPFFKVLSSARADKEDELQAALVNFLTSASVNDRTDDDKTLAMAVLVE